MIGGLYEPFEMHMIYRIHLYKNKDLDTRKEFYSAVRSLIRMSFSAAVGSSAVEPYRKLMSVFAEVISIMEQDIKKENREHMLENEVFELMSSDPIMDITTTPEGKEELVKITKYYYNTIKLKNLNLN